MQSLFIPDRMMMSDVVRASHLPAAFQARGCDVFAPEADTHVPTRYQVRFATLAYSHLQVPGYPHTIPHSDLASELNIPVASIFPATSCFLLCKLK